MFLYKGNIYKTLDLENEEFKTVSNQNQVLIWDTKLPDIDQTNYMTPKKFFAFPEQRLDLFNIAKEKGEFNTDLFLNLFNQTLIPAEVNVIYKRGYYHVSRKITQITLPENIEIKWDMINKLIFVNYKLPVTTRLLIRAWRKLFNVANHYKSSTIISKIENPAELDFFQINNFAAACKKMADMPIMKTCRLLIHVSEPEIYQSLQFIMAQSRLNHHCASSIQEAIKMARHYNLEQRSHLSGAHKQKKIV